MHISAGEAGGYGHLAAGNAFPLASTQLTVFPRGGSGVLITKAPLRWGAGVVPSAPRCTTAKALPSPSLVSVQSFVSVESPSLSRQTTFTVMRSVSITTSNGVPAIAGSVAVLPG